MNDGREPAPLLSVVVEFQTAGLAPEPSILANVDEILRQVAALPAPGGEVWLVSSEEWRERPRGVRNIVAKGSSYYALKNIGAQYASGNVIVFLDADCRIATDYVDVVLRYFASNVWRGCVGGRTRYAGRSAASRVNTALSFGYLWTSPPHQRYPLLAHNVAVRRSTMPVPPFGPFHGRVRGDMHLTNYYRERGEGPDLEPSMLVDHEDCSFSPVLLIERHLREHLKHIDSPGELGLATPSGRAALRSALRSMTRRWHKLHAYGKAVGIGRMGVLFAIVALPSYWLVDCVAVFLTLSVSVLGRRWVAYQNGTPLGSASVVCE